MNTPTTFAGLVGHLLGIINIIIPTTFALVFLFFCWKIIDVWIINAGDDKKLEEGKHLVLVAVLVMTLLFTVWGIVAMLRQSIFGA